MEVISKSKKEIVDRLIDFALFLTWNEKLGRLLMKQKEILPTGESISDLKCWLKDSVCLIRAQEKILIPLGFIAREDGRYLYMASIADKITVVIWNLEKRIDLRKVSERRSKNAIIQWFENLQNKPNQVKSELKKIEEILKSKEVL